MILKLRKYIFDRELLFSGEKMEIDADKIDKEEIRIRHNLYENLLLPGVFEKNRFVGIEFYSDDKCQKLWNGENLCFVKCDRMSLYNYKF
jgi:hypothetical protein